MGNEKIIMEDTLPTLDDLNNDLPTLDELNGNTSPTSDAKKKWSNLISRYKSFRLQTGECSITFAIGCFYIRINSFYIGFIKEPSKGKE